MKGLKKIYQRNIDLFLPLIAVLLGILIMGLQKSVTVQSSMAIPMPQSFLGEYSFDGTNWQPLEADSDLSATHRDLYLRGHFEHDVYSDSRLYFYSDHIGSALSINGELLSQDIILEIEQCGMKIQPSMCSREWKFH